MRKKILISISSTRMIRFFLDTYIFKEIVKQDIDIVVVHQQKTVSNFIRQYENVTEVQYPSKRSISKFKNFIRNCVDIPSVVNRYFSTGSVGFFNLFLNNRSFFKKIKVLVKIALILLIYNIPYIGKRIFEDSFYDSNYDLFLNKYQFDGIILTCPVLEEERIFAAVANKLNIPIVMGVDGWDILVNFGFVHQYGGVLVWGPEMKMHALKLGFKESQIISTGIPYKKKLLEKFQTIDINETKKKYGILENEKVILFFGNNWYATGEVEKKNLELLLNAIKDKLIGNIKIIFRLSPRHNYREEELYYLNKYKDNRNIIFQKPTMGFIDDITNEELASDIFTEVAEVFKISDVLVNILSMSILEAAIVNLPSILCNYDDVFYPTKYVTAGCVYQNLILNGIHEVKDVNRLLPMINEIVNCGNNYNGNKLLQSWDYQEPEIGLKILNLILR